MSTVEKARPIVVVKSSNSMKKEQLEMEADFEILSHTIDFFLLEGTPLRFDVNRRTSFNFTTQSSDRRKKSSNS